MRKVVVGTLVRWQRLALVLGVLVAAWGPAHTAEVAAIDRGVERDATQATSVRLAQPDVMSGLQAEAPADRESRPALADLGGPRVPPGQVRLVMVCVWRL